MQPGFDLQNETKEFGVQVGQVILLVLTFEFICCLRTRSLSEWKPLCQQQQNAEAIGETKRYDFWVDGLHICPEYRLALLVG